MDDYEFDIRLQAIQQLISVSDPLFGENNDDVPIDSLVRMPWPELPTDPLRKAWTLASETCLEATSEQRQLMANVFQGISCMEFIRRIVVHVRASGDTDWVRLGLAAAGIDVDASEYRELLAALAILRYASERATIPWKPLFEQAARECPALIDQLETVANYSKNQVFDNAKVWGIADARDQR